MSGGDDDRLWRAVLDALADGVVVLRPDGRVLSMNPVARRLLGVASTAAFECEGIVGDRALVRPDGTEMSWAEMPIVPTLVSGDRADTALVGVRDGAGVVQWVSVSSTVQRDGRGAPLAVVVTLVEVDGPNRSAGAEARFRVAFEGCALGMLVLDGGNRGAEANDALCEMLRTTPGAIVGHDLTAHLHADDVDAVLAAVRRARLGERTRVPIEARFVTSAGESRYAELNVLRLTLGPDAAAEVLVQMADVTERRREEAALRAEADHDPLTGLLNRRSFERALRAHLTVAARYGPAGALLLADVDRFKRVNDTHGHVAGDDVLREVARLLVSRLRGTDLVARLGGDEFAVLLPLATRSGAEAVAASIVHEVRSRTGDDGPPGWPVTVSVGATMITDDAMAMADVFRLADRALYTAKQNGRNGWELAR